MADYIEKAAAPCGLCLPPSLAMPINFPAGRIEKCPKCKAPAEPKGVYRDDKGDHLHFECYGSVTREFSEGGVEYAERTHHHFDKSFVIKRPGD